MGASLALTWLMFASIRGAREELVTQERIFTIGRLATSIVHDLRNPLAAIYGGAEMLVDQEFPPESVKRLAGNMYRSSQQIQEMLQDLVDVSRGKSPSLEMCRLADVVEAMPGGGEIRIRASRQSKSIMVEVEDTGPGISEAIQSRLFEPFASAGKRNGLGLGLTLSRQTLQAHGGEIWWESRPTHGARFCLRLPC
jgi:signal transduction histidine kinase